jgi:LysM repeat protein
MTEQQAARLASAIMALSIVVAVLVLLVTHHGKPSSTRVSTPVHSSATALTHSPSAVAATSTSPNNVRATPSHVSKPAVTYVVQPGDNLWTLARTLKVDGGLVPLYVWNQSVVGKNPALIQPGQRLIVTPASITIGR